MLYRSTFRSIQILQLINMKLIFITIYIHKNSFFSSSSNKWNILVSINRDEYYILHCYCTRKLNTNINNMITLCRLLQVIFSSILEKDYIFYNHAQPDNITSCDSQRRIQAAIVCTTVLYLKKKLMFSMKMNMFISYKISI